WQHQNQLNEPSQRPRVLFEIQRDGSIRPPRIGQTSGNALYDQAALRAIVEASPFPPLPREWPKPSLTVEMTFQLEPARGARSAPLAHSWPSSPWPSSPRSAESSGRLRWHGPRRPT